MTLDTTRLDPFALAELQSLPPALLRGLPLATVLMVRFPGDVEAGLMVVGDADEMAEPRPVGAVTFAPDEVEALACAVEYGRADAVDLVGWVARKRSDPAFRLDLTIALQGVAPPNPITGMPSWTLARVLREVRAVIVCGSVAAPTQFVLQQAA